MTKILLIVLLCVIVGCIQATIVPVEYWISVVESVNANDVDGLEIKDGLYDCSGGSLVLPEARQYIIRPQTGRRNVIIDCGGVNTPVIVLSHTNVTLVGLKFVNCLGECIRTSEASNIIIDDCEFRNSLSSYDAANQSDIYTHDVTPTTNLDVINSDFIARTTDNCRPLTCINCKNVRLHNTTFTGYNGTQTYIDNATMITVVATNNITISSVTLSFVLSVSNAVSMRLASLAGNVMIDTLSLSYGGAILISTNASLSLNNVKSMYPAACTAVTVAALSTSSISVYNLNVTGSASTGGIIVDQAASVVMDRVYLRAGVGLLSVGNATVVTMSNVETFGAAGGCINATGVNVTMNSVNVHDTAGLACGVYAVGSSYTLINGITVTKCNTTGDVIRGTSAYPLSMSMITLTNVNATGDLLRIIGPYQLALVDINACTADILLDVAINGPVLGTSSATSVNIYGNTARTNAWKTVLLGVQDGYVISATNANMWCNHIDSSTSYAAYYYADTPVVLKWTKFGGHTTVGEVGDRYHFEPVAGNLGVRNITNDYTIFLHTVTCTSTGGTCPDGVNGGPFYNGGSTMRIQGHNIEIADAEPVSVTFLGVPARNIRSIYVNELYFINGDKAGYTLNNQVTYEDSYGRKGLMCTAITHSNGAASGLTASSAKVTAIVSRLGYDSVDTWSNITGPTPSAAAYTMGFRCTIKTNTSELIHGPWYTPKDAGDMRCIIPSSKVPYTTTYGFVYEMTVDAIANGTINNVTYGGNQAIFNALIRTSPVILGVSSRYIVSGVPLHIYGTGFPHASSDTTFRCKYTTFLVNAADEWRNVILPGDCINSTLCFCNVTNLKFGTTQYVAPGVSLGLQFQFLNESWFKLPRKPFKTNPSVSYYNYDFENEKRGFMYMGNWSASDTVQDNEVHIWTIGTAVDVTMPNIAGSDMRYIKDSEVMYCIFAFNNGTISIVEPISYGNFSNSTQAQVRCRVPAGLPGQTATMSVGYWIDYSYKINYKFVYHLFDMRGVHMNHAINSGQNYIYLNATVDYSAEIGYGCGLGGCVCRFTLANGTYVQTTLSNYSSLATYRCKMPIEEDAILTLQLSIYNYGGWKVKVAHPISDASINVFNGVFGANVTVYTSGIDDEIYCGWSRIRGGEDTPSIRGRPVQCYPNARNYSLIVSRGYVINSTAVICPFKDFILGKYEIDSPWIALEPVNSTQYVCHGAYHNVMVTSHMDASYSVDASQIFLYMDPARAAMVNPAFAYPIVQVTVEVLGTNIATRGTVRCWFAELVNRTIMPESPATATVWNVIVEGSVQGSYTDGHRVTCQLPPITNITFIGVVLSNDNIHYDSRYFAKFRYASPFVLSWVVQPSAVTYNLRKLDVQPAVKVTDSFGNIFDDVDKLFQVVISTNPVATSLLNGIADVNATTGVATFTSLQISGPQNQAYDVCMQAQTTDSAFYSTSVCQNSYLSVARCLNLLEHSTELNRTCVCDIGYQMSSDSLCLPCPAHSYRNDTSTPTCAQCPFMHFTNSTGAVDISQCICLDGFIDYNGSCVCAPGREFITYNSTLLCVACGTGFYKDNSSIGQCVPCKKEYETTTFGAVSADDCFCSPGFARNTSGECACDKGFYFNKDLRACWPCDIGYYKDYIGEVASCTRCPTTDHVTTLRSGSTSVMDCVCLPSFVRWRDNDPTTECVCDLGYLYDTKSTICSECQVGYYMSERALVNCTQCEMGTLTANKGSKFLNECMCAEGYYSPSGFQPCSKCGYGAYCAGGNIIPVSKNGYFANTDNTFILCPAGCLGNNTCAEGYEGDLCSVCSPGYYREALQCCKCGGIYDGQYLMYYVGAILLAMPVLAFKSYLPPPLNRATVYAVVIGFMQTMGLFINTNMMMPGLMKQVVAFGAFANGGALYAAVECSMKIDSIDELPLKLLIPIVLFFTLAILYPFHYIWNAIVDKLYIRKNINGLLMYGALVRAFVSTLMMLYLPLSIAVMEYFDCLVVEDGSMRLQRLRSEYCYTGRHMAMLPVAVGGFVFYVLGIPIFVTILLKGPLKNPLNEKGHVFFGCLTAKYEEKHYYWELFILARKFASVLCFILLTTRPSLLALFVVCLCYISSAASYRYRPYQIAPLNTVDVFAYSVIMYLIVVGLGTWSDTEANLAAVMVIGATVLTLVVAFYGLYWRPGRRSDVIIEDFDTKPEFITQMEKASVIVDEPVTLDDLIKFGALFDAEYADLPELN